MSTERTEDVRLLMVLGMHRAGTSAFTRGLQVLGFALGDNLQPPDAGINDKGYWEDRDIVALDEDLLAALGRSWSSPRPVTESDVDGLCAQGYLDRALDLLRRKTEACPQFAFKDPRATKLLPFWKRVFDARPFAVRYVLVLRNPLSIARSLARRDDLLPEAAHLLTVDHLLRALEVGGGEGLAVVDYEQLLEDPRAVLGRLGTWLGAEIDPGELTRYGEQFLDTRLCHSRFGMQDLRTDPAVPALAVEIHEALRETAIQGAPLPAPDRLAAWQLEFSRLQPLLRLVDGRFASHAEALKKAREVVALTERELAAAKDALIRNQAELERERRHAQAQAAEMASLTARLDEVTVQWQAYVEALAAMQRSTSWRLTAPLRFLSGWLGQWRTSGREGPVNDR